jgi:GntR family transcriptional regulator
VSEHVPAYLRIVAELRARIISGDLQAGDRVPSENDIRQAYGVSNTVSRAALAMLRAEGLVEQRRGSGTYVRDAARLVRRAHARNMRQQTGSTSPFARDATAAGRASTWDHRSEHATADARIAGRLGIAVGDPVMVTRYKFLADGDPIQLSESHEPLAVTGGTQVEWPEDGPTVGVVARMDLIGVHVDRCREEIYDRSATPDEVEALRLDPRGPLRVLAVERTYYAGNTAVETADIAFPADRYRLVYDMPIDLPT